MAETRNYLAELERLATDKSSGNRGEMLERMADLFFATSDQQSQCDTAVFGGIMERVAFEVEVEARARLAERMADAEHAPNTLIRRLAEDEIAVARPVLEHSAELSEADLVEIARSHGQDHLRAIAKRSALSEPVTDVIIHRGSNTVLADVAANSGARFSDEGLVRLSHKASEDFAVLSALKTRPEVSPAMLGHIKEAVVSRLTRELANSHPDLSAGEIDYLVEHNLAKLDLDAFDESNRRLERMSRAGQITERMLVDFARARRLPETVRCLALLTGLSDSVVSHCLFKAHLLALGVLCKANGFGSNTFAALLHVRTASEPLRGTVIAAAMRGYNTLARDSAQRILQSVRARIDEPAPAS